MGYTNFPNGVTSFGVPLPNMTQDISGSTFFVDNNSGSDSNDGSSFERAFKTFAKAVAVNNIDIARGSDRWSRRNTIYYCADTETATIVAFPNKCDVIGVGSYDANSKPGITGNHAPVNTGNYGTRFINMWFKAPAVASPIITLASTSSGIQFYGCTFDGVVGTVTTGITCTASPFLVVKNCDFFGGFATANISIPTSTMIKLDITDNTMAGSLGTGITLGTVTTSYGGLIARNIIKCAGVGITAAAAATTMVVGNYVSTDAGKGSGGAGAITATAGYSLQNYISAIGSTAGYNIIVPANGTI